MIKLGSRLRGMPRHRTRTIRWHLRTRAGGRYILIRWPWRAWN